MLIRLTLSREWRGLYVCLQRIDERIVGDGPELLGNVDYLCTVLALYPRTSHCSLTTPRLPQYQFLNFV